jgi:23S rRNA pseudouridine1911/1915/1917 synthase
MSDPIPTPLPLAIRPNPAIAVPIVHEDGDLLIVDKPAGLVTQPGKGHQNDSLLNGLFALQDGLLGKLLHNLGVRRDFGLLHRLDKDTSGLLVIAKTPNAYDQLRRDFEGRQIDKEYLAITAGIPQPAQGVVQARLKEVQLPNPEGGHRGGGTIKKVVISRQGQDAITAYKTLATASAQPSQTASARPAALLHLNIKTGRLHQIRAHMLFLNCHVLGDPLYPPTAESGINLKNYPHAPRLCLHATRLGFKHPATGKWTHYQSPLPPDLAAYAAKLGLREI